MSRRVLHLTRPSVSNMRRLLREFLPVSVTVPILRRRFGTHARLAKEAAAVAQRANVQREWGRPSRSRTLTDLSLHLAGLERYSTVKQLLSEVVLSSPHGSEEREAWSKKLAESLMTSEANLAEPWRWYALSQILASHGLLVASGFARSRGRSLASNTEGPRSIAALEQYCLQSSDVTLRTAPSPEDLLASKQDLVIQADPSINTQPSRIRFSELVHGRRVALVGSGTSLSGGKLLSELEGFETIVTMKSHPRELLTRPYGPVGHLTYLNSHMSRELVREQNVHDWLSELASRQPASLIVTKGLSILNRSDNVRRVEALPRILFSSAQLGLRAVTDLLVASPATLKLFNFDFYSKPIKHDPRSWTQVTQRRQGHRHSDSWYCRAFSHHDLLSQLNYVRILRRAGLVEVDEVCGEVLSMPEEQYLQCVQDTLVTRW